MALTTEPINYGASSDFAVIGKDEAITLGTDFANVLEIDCQKLRGVTIILRLDDAAIDGDYKIFTTCKRNPSSTITSDEWYEELASTSITHNVNTKNTISGYFTKIIVQAKADSGTPILKAWFKGVN